MFEMIQMQMHPYIIAFKYIYLVRNTWALLSVEET